MVKKLSHKKLQCCELQGTKDYSLALCLDIEEMKGKEEEGFERMEDSLFG